LKRKYFSLIGTFVLLLSTLLSSSVYAESISELEKQKPEAGPIDDGDSTTIKKPVIRRKNIRIRDINPSNSWRIETRADLDKYIGELKEKLEKELGENTILNIEF